MELPKVLDTIIERAVMVACPPSFIAYCEECDEEEDCEHYMSKVYIHDIGIARFESSEHGQNVWEGTSPTQRELYDWMCANALNRAFDVDVGLLQAVTFNQMVDVKWNGFDLPHPYDEIIEKPFQDKIAAAQKIVDAAKMELTKFRHVRDKNYRTRFRKRLRDYLAEHGKISNATLVEMGAHLCFRDTQDFLPKELQGPLRYLARQLEKSEKAGVEFTFEEPKQLVTA